METCYHESRNIIIIIIIHIDKYLPNAYYMLNMDALYNFFSELFMP